MTTSDTSTPDEPTPAAEAPEAMPQAHWIWRALITGAALTAAANYLLYSRGPGAGWAVFFVLLAAGIVLNRGHSGALRRIELALGTLLAASALQMLSRPSLSNAIVLSTLTLIASAHFLQDSTDDRPIARKFVEALRKLLLSPMRWLQASHLTTRDGITHASGIATHIPSRQTLTRALQIIVPAAALILPFAILLGEGNSILGKFISNLLSDFFNSLVDVSPPSPGRIFFIAVVATALLGILWRSRPSQALDRLLTRFGKKAAAPSDQLVARWRTILILVGVNVLFFVSNSIDLTYIGSDLQLPRDLSYSEFVHQGTNSLIASAIIAAIVLGLLFQQDESITGARAVRGLAALWIAQNILLIINVARRVGIYISDYHLSVLRLHLLLFLALVCVGFVLLAIRILQRRSFGWLVCANLAAVFTLFAGLQFWDTRKLVAEYNLERAVEDSGKSLDTQYLSQLGPSAWPTLRLATSAKLSKDERAAAAAALTSIAVQEHQRAEREDWRDFRWNRNQLRRTLLAGE